MAKILILTKSVDGGTGTFALSLLKIKGAQIASLENPSFRLLSKKTKERMIFFREKGYYPEEYSLGLRNFINFIQEIFFVKNLISKTSCDIAVGADIHPNLLLQINKLFFYPRIKTVLTTHINLKRTLLEKSSPLISRLFIFLASFFYSFASYNVFVSRRLKKESVKLLKIKGRSIVIYNGIKARKTKIHSAFKKSVVLTVARQVGQKDHETLIRAFNLLIKDLPGVKLWIASDGPKRGQLKKIASDLGIKRSVKFLGWVKDLSYYFKKASFFVLSSKREGFGYVLIEAMSFGLPIISTNTPYGPSEVLGEGKFGILVKVGDTKNLRDKMAILLKDKKAYDHYQKRSLERGKYFSEEKMLNSYSRIFNKLSQ